jgi:hypothetical protein
MEGATAKTNDSVCGTRSFATKWNQMVSSISEVSCKFGATFKIKVEKAKTEAELKKANKKAGARISRK